MTTFCSSPSLCDNVLPVHMQSSSVIAHIQIYFHRANVCARQIFAEANKNREAHLLSLASAAVTIREANRQTRIYHIWRIVGCNKTWRKSHKSRRASQITYFGRRTGDAKCAMPSPLDAAGDAADAPWLEYGGAAARRIHRNCIILGVEVPNISHSFALCEMEHFSWSSARLVSPRTFAPPQLNSRVLGGAKIRCDALYICTPIFQGNFPIYFIYGAPHQCFSRHTWCVFLSCTYLEYSGFALWCWRWLLYGGWCLCYMLEVLCSIGVDTAQSNLNAIVEYNIWLFIFGVGRGARLT